MKYLLSLRSRSMACCFPASRAFYSAQVCNITTSPLRPLSLDSVNSQFCRSLSTTCLNRSEKSNDPFKKPSKEQLLLLREKLALHLPRFLVETHPYNLYTKDVVFENLYQEPGKIST